MTRRGADDLGEAQMGFKNALSNNIFKTELFQKKICLFVCLFFGGVGLGFFCLFWFFGFCFLWFFFNLCLTLK